MDAQMPIAIHLDLADIPQSDKKSIVDGQTISPVQAVISEANANHYDLICIPLTNHHWRARWKSMCEASPDGNGPDHSTRAAETVELWRAGARFDRSEVTITQLDEAEGVIAMLSDWIQLDSAEEGIRYDMEIALRQELAYASYLNLSTVILPPPRTRKFAADYARAVNACLNTSSPCLRLSIRIPIYDPNLLRSSTSSSFVHIPGAQPPPFPVHSRIPDADLSATWEMWDAIRTICNYHPRLSLTLDLTPPLPSSQGVLARWAAEPMHHILLPASSFIPNARGYPVLTKATQAFFRESIKHRPTVILSGTQQGMHSAGGPLAYAQYLRHLEKTSPSVQAMETEGTVENFAKGYWDYLQAPLQPLMDNLQSITYEVFEKDPIKYERYEEAVYQALSERRSSLKAIVCVAGAGRGGLITRCLQAIQRSGKLADVYAIEKNPNAFVTLQERREKEWGTKVRILFGDMRTITLPEKVDILVSELLGSFGDNELSPECLDGASRFLKPDGISIPRSYTAHLAPLSSSKLYHQVMANKDERSAETPYVVMFQAVNLLSGDGKGLRGSCGAKIQECWGFEHPRTDPVVNGHGLPLTNSHNVRSAHLTFHIPHAGILHGLGGYFEACLYNNIGLSIHPDRKNIISPNMLSWFPLYFPFKAPLYLPSNSELKVSIWRLTDARKVWYEWYAESFLPVSAIVPPQTPNSIPNSTAPNGSASSTRSSAHPSPAALLSPGASASPWLDAPWERGNGFRVAGESGVDTSGAIKVGQTALHNAGGASSWIGL